MSVKIFLAHASEDKPRVQQLHKRLLEKGFIPWLDEVDLLAGQKWQQEIPKAIVASDVCLLCLSNTSIQKRGYVQKEFRFALEAYSRRPAGEIFLIPVKLDECRIPPIQMPEVGLDLADFHWVEFWRDDGFDRLVRAVESTIKPYHPPKTENDRQQHLVPCTFEIDPKYAKKRRWIDLADVLVNPHKFTARSDVYLIPSGAVPTSMRHTEILRTDSQALARKRIATERFIAEHRDKTIAGVLFIMRTRRGECDAVYSTAYDRFLREWGLKLPRSSS